MQTIGLITTGLLMGTMMIFGWVFIKHPPKNINYVYGYRTSRSTKNEETWQFAHRTAGGIWLKLGSFGTIVSLLIIFLYDYYGVQENWYLYLTYVQLVLLLVVLPLTERKLKKNFNKDGSRKEEIQ